MTTSSTFAIVGGGLAGAKAAEALRDNDFDGHVVLFAAEDKLPYERPPLSKEYLAGKKKLDDFTVDPAAWYRDHNVDLRLGTEVSALDPAGHTLTLPDGTTVGYDKLLLATGSASRRPPIPGSDAAGVHYLRTIDDAAALSAALAPGATLAIVGAGWIGLEVAAGARSRDVNVTVVEAAHLPLLAALGTEVGEVFAQLHRAHGVDLRLDQSVQEVTTADGTATGLRLGDGSTVAADAVLIAVGAAPNIGLAEQAGLAVADGGVLVDASLRTSDPDIYAVGDIAAAQHPFFGVRIHTEHWANALKQPAVAVAGMLGKSAEYDELPYFFTDQYDLGMEYVGHAPEYQRVVFRGDVAGREFVAFWLDGANRVLAGMNVNVWDVLDDVKALIRSAAPVDPDRIADPTQPLPVG
ncbi:pyridine nucleotide-disulfide oxidoreductase [Mycolicibacterium conceptionense]|jgi:3-phenylpropionate/trans-cinnamate dioxygenase ferredoxin reductase subunit|uniref:Pyridine nucleotide-disulfide oxidoreductase n=2 Tax=Mycolicibacterium TaxID=1866885 RepID=A0ABR5FQP3_9MYCO|nr:MULTISPECIES: FAD-dependent oxidoreductase [Mycolicibacterium]KLI07055.1 pyridine nucleotide-disulfide oxidoreductase [Mycolicibacterium senegalense]KLO50262.1 pyridine nucleotide-disulfide oxidoreductase [Mycolicibacterium senegalense]KMV19491.1 pyridine nucleotide-disulfide oxidoreductase [Mycolicibacterium conceptionense]OBK03846.1 pyridine nucleotide-disulfide oxidoreductase [Mycolicibacterium conceptionense]OMB68566.1 pyridine nucleotide-disulfide oxidoreductase [Mycolicibacterium conc